jgi:hypothetical protein
LEAAADEDRSDLEARNRQLHEQREVIERTLAESPEPSDG